MGVPGYAGWVVQLDPPAVATDRTMLDINSGAIQIGGTQSGTGPDWGQSEITAYESQQGSYGNNVAALVYPNRTVTIPLFISDDGDTAFEDALSDLRMKVGLLQREGGQILRQRLGGEAMYADIETASLVVPDAYGETGGIESGITLTLECLPDFYGDEVTLDSASATGVLHAVLQESSEPAVIAGDYPARCRIIVTDTSGNDQHGLFWAFRSRHHDAASTAALFYEAEALTPLNGAASATLSGASGGHAVAITNPPVGDWVPMLVTTMLSGSAPLTHKGSYRVRARCYSDTDLPQFRLVWGVGSLAVPETNDPVLLPGAAEFCVLDLGTVRLDAPPVGSQQWIGVVQVLAQGAGTDSIDCLYLEPLDESAGELAYVPVAPAGSVSSLRPAGGGADDSGVGTVAWSSPGQIAVEDGSSANIGTAGTTHYLKSSAHGFSIPSGATIAGIQVDIKRAAFTLGVGITDNRVRLAKAGTVQATDRANTLAAWPGSLAFASYGGPTDPWGGGWTPADINSSGFGAAISATVPSGVTFADVDFIRITVYYTLASGFTVAQDAVVYANEVAEIRTDGPYRDNSSGVYGPVSSDTGDLPRLPPSGMEGRPCELLVKPSRGDLDTLADSGLDGFTVQVIYRPAWMFRP